MTVYSIAQQEQFVNNADDRTRGVGTNPFGNFKDNSPVTGKASNGPFAGDEAIFSFNLYSDAALKKRVGSAMFMCYYGVARNAFCDASYRLSSGGTLIASGAFNFAANRFTLAVTGGYGSYSGRAGTVVETPSAKHAQKLLFSLNDAVAATRTTTLEAKPTARTFVNNNDDRQRGRGKNPFGNYAGAGTVPTNEGLFGPFPGDEGLFASGLYAPSAKAPGGSSIFICQYNFNAGAICDASFKLPSGTLVAKGSYDFEASKFTLAVIGGTGSFRGTRGQLAVTAKGLATQALPARRAVPMLQAKHLVFRTGTAPIARKVVEYITPTNETFINNDDDYGRGKTVNPWVIPKPVSNSDDDDDDEEAQGPFAGDAAYFNFKLHVTSSISASNGSSAYSCQYSFAKNAFCDAVFRVNGGTIYASGAFNFNAKTYDLAITGGAGTYQGATGEVAATPSGAHSEKLVFSLA